MKKIFLLFTMVIFSAVFLSAEKIQVVKGGFIRSSVTAKDNQGWAKPGQVFDVLEKIGAYHYIKITGGSIHAGISGWTWRKYLDGEKLKEGIILRSGPGKKYDPVMSEGKPVKVKTGATYDLIKKDVKWYKIAVNKFIFHSYVKLIE